MASIFDPSLRLGSKMETINALMRSGFETDQRIEYLKHI